MSKSFNEFVTMLERSWRFYSEIRVAPMAVPLPNHTVMVERTEATSMKRKFQAKNPHAVALGRLGGLVGGPIRAQSLSARERQSIARKAARARWTKALRERRAS
jgi:hypothetical protein